MKKYFILVLVLFLTSCQEDDPRHPIEGTWDDKDSDSYLIFDSNTLSAYADYYNDYGPECRLEADWVEVPCSGGYYDDYGDDESCLMFSNPTLEYASDEGESESCGIYYEYYRIREYEPEVWYTVSSDSLYLSYPFYMTLSRR